MSKLSFAEEKQQFHRPYDVEGWYKLLEDLTFETTFFSLQEHHAKAITNCYQSFFLGRPLLKETAASLADLRSCLLVHLSSPSDPYFIRLSSRSPKDALSAFSTGSLAQGYEQQLARWQENPPPSRYQLEVAASDAEWRANTCLLALAAAQAMLIPVYGADDGVERLVKSERVFQDLLIALDAAQMRRMKASETEGDATEAKGSSETDDFGVQVCLRKWEPRLRDDLEFRCFVWQGQLTAISQYNHYLVLPGLGERMPRIATAIEQFWVDKVATRIGMPADYVIDVAVWPSPSPSPSDSSPSTSSPPSTASHHHQPIYTLSFEEPLEIRVIELNPFAETTGAALFDWREKELKERPLSIRTRQTIMPFITDFLEVNLKELDQQVGISYLEFITQKNASTQTENIESKTSPSCKLQ